jgi:hypothetical protein
LFGGGILPPLSARLSEGIGGLLCTGESLSSDTSALFEFSDVLTADTKATKSSPQTSVFIEGLVASDSAILKQFEQVGETCWELRATNQIYIITT